MSSTRTFIIDCPVCKAKVAAGEEGRAESTGFDHENGEPWGQRLYVGHCPRCHSLVAGESVQTGFENFDSDEDIWSDAVRIFPNPPKSFASLRIPEVVRDSLAEADRSLQANANVAACAMLGRALEAVCRDILEARGRTSQKTSAPKKKLMLAAGIKELRKKNIIDDRLFEWSQQLHAFRNIAAHPEVTPISRQDAVDLQTFVYAIVEYIYDLSDRYNEFKVRLEKRGKRQKD